MYKNIKFNGLITNNNKYVMYKIESNFLSKIQNVLKTSEM
jgi:hypothetical protein